MKKRSITVVGVMTGASRTRGQPEAAECHVYMSVDVSVSDRMLLSACILSFYI